MWTYRRFIHRLLNCHKLSSLPTSRTDFWIERLSWSFVGQVNTEFDDCYRTVEWTISLLAFYCILLSSLEQNIPSTDEFLTGKGFSYLWSVGRRRRGTIPDTSAAMDLPVTPPQRMVCTLRKSGAKRKDRFFWFSISSTLVPYSPLPSPRMWYRMCVF